MVSSEIKKLGKVVVGGGKTARACDNCIRKRAQWYCAADDAFLCQSCDGSVHSANPLARRHERVRLNFKHIISSLDHKLAAPPPWYQGFTKKPRTPRAGNKHVSRQTQQKSEEDMMSFINPLHLVPEMEISTVPACEEQLLYRVPELCFSENSSHEMVVKQTTPPAGADGSKVMILPSDVELAEFAADVESLLGKGLDEESTFAMEGLGLLDYCSRERSVMKVEVEEDDQMQTEIILLETTEMEMLREPAYDQLRFDYDDSSATANLWEEEKEHGMCMQGHDHHLHTNILKYHDEKKNKRILLKLDNYDGIIAAWDAEQRSPWTTGDRPEFDPNDDSWPECMGGILMAHHGYGYGYGYGDVGMSGAAMLDGGREARVTRYREKRRTRLFSKKIRYEVRKLNAEKRPRMKGRFVKRPSSSSGFPLLTK